MRLGAFFSGSTVTSGMPFQFQLGAIGSSDKSDPYIFRNRFNSSLVRLGVKDLSPFKIEIIRFNSSLVRLGAPLQ